MLWARTLRRWDREILGYLQYPLSNGYTEECHCEQSEASCHTKVKLLKRLSYGFRNVEVYIRKMLLGFLPHISRSPGSTHFDIEPACYVVEQLG